jgi:membrane protease YdiL (CAAX protease family)
MAHFFFSPNPSGRNEWWWYLLTLFLVITGIFGFGLIPFQAALQMKGVTAEEQQHLGESGLKALFTNNELITYNLFPLIIGLVMLLLAFRSIHRRKALTFITTREQFDFKRFFTGFAIWGGLLGILFAIGYMQHPSALKWNYHPQEFLMLFLICIFLVPLQTGFEEVFCRGFVLQWTGKATNRGIAIILINGLIFGGLHSLNPEMTALGWFAMAFYILSGVFAALLTVMDDGIELSWGYHTANNIVGLLIVSTNWQGLQTDSLFIDTSKPAIGIELIITLVVCYPLMVFLLSKIYRWTGWKERLLGK